MVQLLADENFNQDIVRGLLRRLPGFPIVRVRDVGLEGKLDPERLEWAAANGRIVVTHDQATMPCHAYQRVLSGLPMPGVFLIHSDLPTRSAIEELLLVVLCSNAEEWIDRVEFLPL